MSVPTTNIGSNPYSSPSQASPARRSQESEGTRPLFSMTQIAMATFFGTIGAGATLMAINYVRLRKTNAAVIAMAVGLLALIAVLAVSFAMSASSIGSLRMIVLIAQVLGMKQLAAKLFVQQYNSEKFQRSSNWAVVGIALTWLVAVLGAAVAFVIALGL